MRFVAVLLFASIAATARDKKALALPDAIQLVGPSVVSIQCVFDHRPKQTQEALHVPFYRWVCGTGFIVNDAGYVITALHVIRMFEHTTAVPVGQQQVPMASGTGRLVAGIALHVDGQSIQIRESTFDIQMSVVDRDEKHDIALLKMVRSQFRTMGDPPVLITQTEQVNAPIPGVAMFDTKRPAEGEAIAVSGYPLDSGAMKTNSGTIASSWATDKNQKPGDLVDSYVTDMRVNHGDSGGPVNLVKTGAVMGLCNSFVLTAVTDENQDVVVTSARKRLVYNSGLANVVPAKYIVQILDKNNVKWFPVR